MSPNQCANSIRYIINSSQKSFSVLFDLLNGLTCVQLYANSNDATDLDICVSGGRVRANVGKSFFCDVSWCVQNFFYIWEEKKTEQEKQMH